MTRSEATRIRGVIETEAQSLDDHTALTVANLYPEWAADTAYAAGRKVRHSGKLWRVIQPHTSQVGWEPERAPALWEQINETHAGTQADPIPYSGSMALELGKHYSQDGIVYQCTQGTGIPVYNALSELVGIYVVPV